MDEYQAAKKSREDTWKSLESTYKKATNVLAEKWGEIEKGHEDLQKKKDALAKQNEGLNVEDSDILDINAGGRIVRVSRGTLTQKKGTRLEAIFSGRWEKELHRDSKGRIFLDVNPDCFKCIVDYLNECKIAPLENPPELPKTDEENQVVLNSLLMAFGIYDIPPVDSKILTNQSHVVALEGYLQEDGLNHGLELLYRGSRDGMNGNTFHSKCDNQGPTVTVIKSSGGYIFGGFSSRPWDNLNTNYFVDPNAFLFGLHCYGGSCPVKMRQKETAYAIYNSPENGPSFGGGHDLIAMGGDTYSNLGHSYHRPAGGSAHYFTGTRSFVISDVEVFKVVQKEAVKAPKNTTQAASKLSLNGLPDATIEAIQAEESALSEASIVLEMLKKAFQKEQAAIKVFCQGGQEDIAVLNVSGTTMALKHTTLANYPNSVLYKQFADPNWQGKRKRSSPKEWQPSQVVAWSKTIEGLTEDLSKQLKDVTGQELLVLEREDIKELGIKRPGTIALVINAIKKLRDEEDDSAATFIEHSDYCFGKIIDHMRLKAMKELDVPNPPPPEIREPDRKRFKRIVEYYFPTEESAADFLAPEK